MSRLPYIVTMLMCVAPARAADLPEVIESEATAIYEACRSAIAEWASAYQPIDMQTTLTGPVQHSGETQVAHLYVRLVYDRQGGPEPREAHIECTRSSSGISVAPMDS